MSELDTAIPNSLRVFYVTAEADPFIKVGGLGDVAGSLPRALRSLPKDQTGGVSVDIRLVIPFHSGISISPHDLLMIATLNVPHPNGPILARAYLTQTDGVPVYLIAGDPIRPDSPVYSANAYLDGEKFIFFSLATLELARLLDWRPDILHVNDWHTAIGLHALTLQKNVDDFFQSTRSMITIHNLPFMGAGAEEAIREYGLPLSSDENLPVWARQLPLPMGLSAADKIIAVSPTYAQEITTAEFGCGLEDFLITRGSSLSGILNGLDYAARDPSKDPALPVQFGIDTIADRINNKKSLLAEMSFPVDEKIPLLAFIGRMDQQKGIDIAVEALSKLRDYPWRAIFLGSGNAALENLCRRFETELPDKVRTAIRFDPQLSLRIYGGSDMLMMPSRYEPCGLAQMIAMRYGCVPIARATGGLKDTIIETKPLIKSTGFIFKENQPVELADTILRAINAYKRPKVWRTLQLNGMKQNFSWDRSAMEYFESYKNLKLRTGL